MVNCTEWKIQNYLYEVNCKIGYYIQKRCWSTKIPKIDKFDYKYNKNSPSPTVIHAISRSWKLIVAWLAVLEFLTYYHETWWIQLVYQSLASLNCACKRLRTKQIINRSRLSSLVSCWVPRVPESFFARTIT